MNRLERRQGNVRGILLGLACAILLAACDDSTGVELGGVEATVVSEGLRLENQRSRTIYYFVADQSLLPLLDWAPCRNPDLCDGVESDERVIVPKADIIGWGESDVLVVYWWELDRQGNGEYEIDEIRTMKVDY